ncbi:MAG: glycosyltransferase [Propionibacterium sp.]|nr:glycosyltransferase [Propionibacterium sp.]
MSARPRVVVVTTWLPTPAAPVSGIFVQRDIRALSTIADVRGVHLVPPTAQEDSARARIGEIPVLRIPLTPSRPDSVLRALPPLHSALQGADLVHSMAVSSLLPLGLLRVRVPWVHTEHWSVLAEQVDGVRGLAVRGIARVERLPDVVAAVSPDLAERLGELAGRRVEVVPNIVEAPPPGPRRFRRPGEELRLIGVGGLIERKRPLLAVRTAAALAARGTPVHLTWVGEGPLEEQVRREAHRLGVPLGLGGVLAPDRVPQALARADVFLVPSRAETFFLGAAEALAAGRPVVVGDSAGPRSFVAPPTGRLVDSEDPQDWADAVERVWQDTAGMDADEIARSVQRFSAHALARAYSELYATARSRRAGRALTRMRGRLTPGERTHDTRTRVDRTPGASTPDTGTPDTHLRHIPTPDTRMGG